MGLIQHRRMRDAGLRAAIREAVIEAVVAREDAVHEALLDAHLDKHEEAGGTQDDWEEPFSFDTEAAEAIGAELAAQAISPDPVELTAASKEIEAMGLDVVELMGGAYRTFTSSVQHHDQKGQERERRRREVKRDFDALQKARPVVAEVEVIEG